GGEEGGGGGRGAGRGVWEGGESGGKPDALDVHAGSERLPGGIDEGRAAGVGALESAELDRRVDEWGTDRGGDRYAKNPSSPPPKLRDHFHSESIRLDGLCCRGGGYAAVVVTG